MVGLPHFIGLTPLSRAIPCSRITHQKMWPEWPSEIVDVSRA